MAKWGKHILSSHVVSLPLQFVIQEVANFCAAMDTSIDQDEEKSNCWNNGHLWKTVTDAIMAKWGKQKPMP